MDIKEFIANKKAEINNEWEDNQKDEWTNGYYNALSDIEQALSQHDVMRSAFKEAYDKWHDTKDDGELGNWLFAKSKGITT